MMTGHGSQDLPQLKESVRVQEHVLIRQLSEDHVFLNLESDLPAAAPQ